MNSNDLKLHIDKMYGYPEHLSTHPKRIAKVNKNGSVFRLFMLESVMDIVEIEVGSDFIKTEIIKVNNFTKFDRIAEKYRKINRIYWLG